jgi:spermidine/putrescine-binding protein
MDMAFLQKVLGEDYEAFTGKIESYNAEHPEDAVKLANLAGGQYVDKGKYDALQARTAELEARLEGAEAVGSDAELAAAKARYEAEIESLRAALENERVEHALDAALIQAGARNVKAARALIDFSALSFEDGVLIGLDEQLAQIMLENGFLFSRTTGATGMRQSGARVSDEDFLESVRKGAGLE